MKLETENVKETEASAGPCGRFAARASPSANPTPLARAHSDPPHRQFALQSVPAALAGLANRASQAERKRVPNGTRTGPVLAK